MVNARWLPPDGVIAPWQEPCVALIGDEIAYAVLPTDYWPEDTDDELQTWTATLPRRTAGGRLVRYLWELVHLNGEQIARDFTSLGPAPGA